MTLTIDLTDFAEEGEYAVRGNFVVYRKQSGWTPASVTGLHAWFKTEAGILNASDAVASNGENVKTWQDQSGNGNHAVQAVVGQQPTYSTTGLNSAPCLVFDQTTSDHLLAPVSITGATCAAFFALSLNEFTSQYRISSLCNAANADYNDSRSAILSWRYDVGKQQSFRNGSGLSSKSVAFSETPPVKAVIATVFDGVNNTFYWNGVAQATVASTDVFSATKLYLSCGQSGTNTPAYFCGSSIREAILYNTAPTPANIALISDYLNAKIAAY